MFEKKPKLITLNIYMKSGNILVIDNVDEEMTITAGSTVTGIKNFKQHNPKNRLFLNALDLNQIEAIVIND